MMNYNSLNKVLSALLSWLKSYMHRCFFIVIAILACGCGGSSDSSNTTFTTSNPTTAYTQTITPQSIVAFDHEIKTGQPVDLFLYYPNDNITNILWEQIGGIPVTILTPNSKGLSFTPSASDNYTFEVRFNVNNTTTTLTHTVNVSSQQALLAARLGHVVNEQNNVSLRTSLMNELESAADSLTWTQVSGPSVNFTDPLDPTLMNDGTGQLVVYFEAPAVPNDTLIEFEVSAIINQTTYSDRVAVLVENDNNIAANAYFDDRLSSVSPFSLNSDVAENLVDCTYSNQLSSSCTFNTLPLIAQETLSPTVDDIMDRVVVSHPWMAENFREFLTLHDPNDDFKNLLRATTAIVISYDIRPSFYWAATGAIYLDPNNLWLTPEQRDTINEAPDFRSDYGTDLQFSMPWRYVKNNQYAYSYLDITERSQRVLGDIVYPLSSLLYHELAHANDFLPSTEWNIHNSNVRILDAVLSSNFESDDLTTLYPLTNSQMYNLANVRFQGNTASNTQKNYVPSDITTFFTSDIANDFYNYASTREDFAMLFEEFMMQIRFNVQRDTAITSFPQGDNITGSDYIVDWGQRGRIGEENIKTRVNMVLSRVLPTIASIERSELLDDLPSPLQMIKGDDWYENLVLTPMVTSQSVNHFNPPRLPSSTRYYHKALPSENSNK